MDSPAASGPYAHLPRSRCSRSSTEGGAIQTKCGFKVEDLIFFTPWMSISMMQILPSSMTWLSWFLSQNRTVSPLSTMTPEMETYPPDAGEASAVQVPMNFSKLDKLSFRDSFLHLLLWGEVIMDTIFLA